MHVSCHISTEVLSISRMFKSLYTESTTVPAKIDLEDNFRCFEARLKFLLSCMK